MKKLAIFVEGQTEAAFCSKLTREIAGVSRGSLQVMAAKGRTGRRTLYEIKRDTVNTGQPFYALIIICGGDSTVVSDIKDQYASLSAKGYTMILGLRDVYPSARAADRPRLREQIDHTLGSLGNTPVPEVRVILAVMEVEAWFIAEDTHFQRLDAGLTCTRINAELGIDPCVVDVEALEHPSESLRRIYNLVGRLYRKRKDEIEATVDALDYTRLYLETRTRVPGLAQLLERVDHFLADET